MGGWWSGVKTMTSSPAARSPLMRHSKRFFMPLTWLKGLGSCVIQAGNVNHKHAAITCLTLLGVRSYGGVKCSKGASCMRSAAEQLLTAR